MISFDNILPYLEGVKFSNHLLVNIGCSGFLSNKIICRDEFLTNLCKNKKVLHIGFLDHIDLIEQKIKENLWLHAKLIESSKICYGLDIDANGINYVKKKFGIKNIYFADIFNMNIPSEIYQVDFDLVLLPDVIEHLNDPVLFLSRMKKCFQNVEKLVITTPNAFRLQNFTNVLRGIEILNSDHRYWFTPYTLSKVVITAGFKKISIIYAEHRYTPRRKLLKKIILKKYPQLRDCIILKCRF